MINSLIAEGIEPIVTMYHYDMPEELNKFGGITNEIFIKYFRLYADTLFENFGDRVKVWITFNEPFDYCNPGYGVGNFPPNIHSPGVLDYMCMDITLKSHASVYQLYKNKYYQKQQGKIGITISSRFHYSLKNEAQIVERAMQYSVGKF